MKKYFVILFVLNLLFSHSVVADGFLKVSGKTIVNGQGNEFILRGMGLGGWMLPEGYMLQMSSFANAPWEIKKKIVEVVGVERADTFWTAYRKNFVQRKDIERLAQFGFNSVRLAMHYEFYIRDSAGTFVRVEQGFSITDSLLQWCADNHMYLILDLHAAPGGQSANNISDYNPSLPSLWASEKNKSMTVELWRMLAEHYKDQPWVGGYDILNEPAWDLPPDNKPLRDLSVAITTAIRTVDTTHIVFVEGNWYASDFNGMAPAWDDNMAWSFHKYWNTNDQSSLNNYVNIRNSTNRPLWLGESGENSNAWFTDCITLVEANNIGWAWWTIKKFGTITGPFSIPLNTEYSYLLRYWKGEVSQPSVEYAMKGLMGMANGLELEQCVYNKGVIDAMMRQPYDNTVRPFAANGIPGKLFATDYDYGKYSIAYRDVDYQSTNQGGSWNNGWIYRNDGVDIEKCSDVITNGYDVGHTGTGEYLTFTMDVQQSGNYTVTLRAAVNTTGGYVGISWDGQTQKVFPLAVTGGWQSWGNHSLGSMDLTAGNHHLRLNEFGGGFNLNYIDLSYAGPIVSVTDQMFPGQYALAQNYPNPFNPSTVIEFQIPFTSFVTLSVTDLLGREIMRLVDGMRNAGKHAVTFDATQVSSGIYFYTLQTDGFRETRKLSVMK
ncbi:MAG: cellulase family glycosylhydrolase [Bacteroidota bacterium]